MANNLTISDISTVANNVFKNSIGNTTSVNLSDFVACADITLKSGAYDPFNTALSQVLSKTIFSIRPYSAKFKGLIKDDIKWGNHVRKLQVVEEDPTSFDGSFFEASNDFLDNGDTVDMWKIKAPKVLQTNFYGQETYQKGMTVWVDQINTALSSPQEFGNFLTMVMTNASDQLEQTREGLRRGTLANLIGGAVTLGQVRHLLTEYNTLTGLSLTATSVYQPANYKAFMQYVYSVIRTATQDITDRTLRYHVNPVVLEGGNGVKKNLARHTPYEYQHLYFLSEFINRAEDMAIADVFHDDYLTRADYEVVNFWMDASNKGTINTTVNYLTAGDVDTDTASAITTASVNNAKVVGVLWDDEAAGINMTRQHATVTPVNAKGLYTNYYWTETSRWWNDNTENCIVFCLD